MAITSPCQQPDDNQESSRWNIGSLALNIAVSWTRHRVVIACSRATNIWSLNRQEEIFKISIDDDNSVVCSVALSEDTKTIVSGIADGNVRGWNAQFCEFIIKPKSGHRDGVKGLAIRSKLFVSGSVDGLLYRWNAAACESIDNATEERVGGVRCVAVSADSELIESGTRYRAIRRWDAGTGDLVSSPFKIDQKVLTKLAISSDGEFVVSGSADGIIRRWRSGSQDATCQPLRSHTG